MAKCSCFTSKSPLGLISFDCSSDVEEAKNAKKIRQKFFMANGIKTDSEEEAADILLSRDHKDLVDLKISYKNGQLGAKFVPPIFFSEIPEIIEPEDFKNKVEREIYEVRI